MLSAISILKTMSRVTLSYIDPVLMFVPGRISMPTVRSFLISLTRCGLVVERMTEVFMGTILFGFCFGPLCVFDMFMRGCCKLYMWWAVFANSLA